VGKCCQFTLDSVVLRVVVCLFCYC